MREGDAEQNLQLQSRIATKRSLGSSKRGLLKWKCLCEKQLYVIIFIEQQVVKICSNSWSQKQRPKMCPFRELSVQLSYKFMPFFLTQNPTQSSYSFCFKRKVGEQLHPTYSTDCRMSGRVENMGLKKHKKASCVGLLVTDRPKHSSTITKWSLKVTICLLRF